MSIVTLMQTKQRYFLVYFFSGRIPLRVKNPHQIEDLRRAYLAALFTAHHAPSGIPAMIQA